MPLCINSVYHGVTVPWFGFDNAGFAVLQTTARLGILGSCCDVLGSGMIRRRCTVPVQPSMLFYLPLCPLSANRSTVPVKSLEHLGNK